MAIPLDSLHHVPPQPDPQRKAALFRYRALESHGTFRLLRLRGGKGDKVHCSLHHYALGAGTCPSYRALSYTWGQDAPRFDIHLPGNSIIKVRENSMNALRSLREQDADCWLWIDAICINQASNQERNHQVRLMADIYSNANIVVAWLPSTGQKANVATAFHFIHAAVTYDDTAHSVYHYLSKHSRDDDTHWKAVQALCSLRYWTRKWIIQELVIARTVVLQAGKAKCSMADLETFCRALHPNGGRKVYQKFRSARRIVSSPAALLALQRMEPRDEQQQPRLLYRLIERYANSECALPCDHVYALYSLAGRHRTHLSIDYAASPMQRVVAVLDFVHTHENLPPSKTLDFAHLLVRLLRLKQDDFLQERHLSENLHLVVHATLLGTVEIQPESQGSIALRAMVKPLHPMPIMSLDISADIWVLQPRATRGDVQEGLGGEDMIYFSIAGSSFHGLAACSLASGDAIYHFPHTQLVFAVRSGSGREAFVLGRAYLFSPARDGDAFEPWLSRSLDYDDVRLGQRNISMNLTTLLELGSFAVSTKDGGMDLKMNGKTLWRWRIGRPREVAMLVTLGIIIVVVICTLVFLRVF